MPRHRSNQPRGRGGPWAVVAALMLAARASATPAPSPNGMCTAPTYATSSCSALGGVCVTESSCSGTHTAEGCGETPACGCCFRTPAPSPVDTDDDDAVPRFHDTIILFTIAISTALFGLYYLVLVLRVPNKHDAPFRQRLTAYASNSVLGTVLDLINAAYSFISCVFFVWDTYLTRPPIWMFALEAHFATYFMYAYFQALYMAKNPFTYLITSQALVDKVTVLPIFLGCIMGDYTGGDVGFLRMLKIMKITRIFRLMRLFRSINVLVSPIDDAINNQATLMVTTVMSLIVISTGFIWFIANDVEDHGDPRDAWMTQKKHVSFHDALYFTIVTFSTVGYGDMAPQTATGRLIIIVLILIFVYLVPSQTQRLVQLLDLRSKYSSAFKLKHAVPHIVVGCDTNCTAIAQFLREFFHEDHGMKSTRVCLVVPAEPDLEWKSLLLQYSAKQRLQYLKGDLMRRYDLIRARLDMASACFILTDQYCSDTDKADSVTFLRALAVSKFNRNIKCFVELIEPENKKHLLAVGISHHRIVCCREIRMGLLAQAALMKGFSALVSNVVASSSVEEDIFTEAWHEDYCHGLEKEVYRVMIGAVFGGQTWGHVVRLVFRDFHAILFAIGNANGVALHPGADHVIDADDYGFLFADDIKVSDEILAKYLTTQQRNRMERRERFAEMRMHNEQLSRQLLSLGDGREQDQDDGAPSPPVAGSIPLQRIAPSDASDAGAETKKPPAWASPALSQQRALPPLLEPTATGDGSDLVQDSGGLRRRKPAPEFSLRTGAKDGAMVPKMSQLSLFAAQEATRHALPPEVRAHWVILTQILDDLEHIVVRLRRPHLTSRSIVIVCPLHDWSHLSDDRAWKRINAFPGVHLIKGIPQQEEDLARANVRESQGVILVSGKSEADAELVQIDSNTLLSAVNVQTMLSSSKHDVRMVGELNDEDHIEHYGVISEVRATLQTGKRSSRAVSQREAALGLQHYELNRSYAAGDIVLANFPELLLCQAFFNSHIISVMHEMLSGAMSSTEHAHDPLPGEQTSSQLNADTKRSCLVQVKVPNTFWKLVKRGELKDSTFSTLMAFLLDKYDALPIAVYHTDRQGLELTRAARDALASDSFHRESHRDSREYREATRGLEGGVETIVRSSQDVLDSHEVKSDGFDDLDQVRSRPQSPAVGDAFVPPLVSPTPVREAAVDVATTPTPGKKTVQAQYGKRPTTGSSGGSQAGDDDSVRYVVTNPAPEREMVASDLVFVLLHDKTTFELLRTDSDPDEMDALSMFGSELTAADSTSRWAPPHQLNASMNRIDQVSMKLDSRITEINDRVSKLEGVVDEKLERILSALSAIGVSGHRDRGSSLDCAVASLEA